MQLFGYYFDVVDVVLGVVDFVYQCYGFGCGMQVVVVVFEQCYLQFGFQIVNQMVYCWL